MPLWQTWVVDDVEGGSALIMRCHHCIADGTAMMILIQKLYDPAPGAPPLQAPRARGKSLKQADQGLLAPAHQRRGGRRPGRAGAGRGRRHAGGRVAQRQGRPARRR
jgi:hypothetical protein